MRAASNQSQKAKMRNPFKLSLIGIFALTGAAEIWQRVVSLIEFEIQYFALVAFSTLLALSTFSLIGAAFISNKFLRWALAGILASGSVFIDSYQWAVGDFMDYESFITMISSSGDLGNAIDQYGSEIFLALIRGDGPVGRYWSRTWNHQKCLSYSLKIFTLAGNFPDYRNPLFSRWRRREWTNFLSQWR